MSASHPRTRFNTQSVKVPPHNNNDSFRPKIIDRDAFEKNEIPPYQEEEYRISEFIRNHKVAISVVIIVIVILLVLIFIWKKYKAPIVSNKEPDTPNPPDKIKDKPKEEEKVEKEEKEEEKVDEKIELSDSEDEEHVKKSEVKLKPPKRSDIINKAKKNTDANSEDFYNEQKVDEQKSG